MNRIGDLIGVVIIIIIAGYFFWALAITLAIICTLAMVVFTIFGLSLSSVFKKFFIDKNEAVIWNRLYLFISIFFLVWIASSSIYKDYVKGNKIEEYSMKNASSAWAKLWLNEKSENFRSPIYYNGTCMYSDGNYVIGYRDRDGVKSSSQKKIKFLLPIADRDDFFVLDSDIKFRVDDYGGFSKNKHFKCELKLSSYLYSRTLEKTIHKKGDYYIIPKGTKYNFIGAGDQGHCHHYLFIKSNSIITEIKPFRIRISRKMDGYPSNIKIYHKHYDEISIPVMQKLVVCRHREVRVHVYIPNYFDITAGSNLNQFLEDAKKWADLTCGVEGYKETTVAIYQEGTLFKNFGYLKSRKYHK